MYQYIFTVCYALITAVWQFGTGDAVIFPRRLDWICKTRNYNADDPNCIFSQCFVWFFVFLAIQTTSFTTLLLVHYGKAKFICRRSDF